MKLLVKDIIKETNDAISICFKNGNFFKKLKYKPGQFLTIHTSIHKNIEKRAYSFSSNPFTDKDLKITIKRVDKGLVSNFVHDNLKIGDKIEVDDPAGSFFVEPSNTSQKQYILFAGGSGVTPIFSIIKSVLTQEEKSKILLIYANQNIDSIIFHDEIKDLENTYSNTFKVEHLVSNIEKAQGNYHSGLATKEAIDQIFSKHNIEYYDSNEYMVCGPFGYMEKIKEILKENGISRDKLKIEVFKKPEVKVTGENLESLVKIRLKGKEHQIKINGNKSILRQAMSNNIPLPYSCRSGMCSTCKAKCIEGEVKMTEGHFLSEKEVEQGNVLTCISYPVSKEVLLEI